MCVIFACYEKFPSEMMLERGANGNRDGAGVAWIDPKEKMVRWVKGLPSDAKEVKKVLKGIKSVPVLIHFRIASVGGAIKELTHPFPVTPTVSLANEGTAEKVLMHNGHWGSWRETTRDYCLKHNVKPPTGPFSDSRAMAFLAAKLGVSILPLLDMSDRIIVLNKEGNWNYWGNWYDAEKHKEEGYLLSHELYGGSVGTSGRSHKSDDIDLALGEEDSEDLFNVAWWNNREETKGKEGGEKPKEAGQEAKKSTPGLGGPSSPLALGPGDDPTTGGRSKSSSTSSPVTSARDSSDTHRDAPMPPLTGADTIDAEVVSNVKTYSPQALDKMLGNIRTQLGMGGGH